MLVHLNGSLVPQAEARVSAFDDSPSPLPPPCDRHSAASSFSMFCTSTPID